ncbi:MAG: penicillin-binding protein 2 [Verrucomicrobiae bacterium]|nr:penicillin-binding protein 2 [Verrucomicrobiae bacterium]
MTVAGLLLAGFGYVGFRLFDLQVTRHEELAQEASRKHEKKIVLPAVRGSILDRNENQLAHSVAAKVVAIDPQCVREQDLKRSKAGRPSMKEELAAVLSEQLGLPRLEIDLKLLDSRRYVVLKRKVLQEETGQLAQILRERKLQGVIFDEDQVRTYPNSALMSHVLGYVNSEGRGMDGVELLMQQELQGQNGWRRTECDRQGREIVVFRNEDFSPTHGYNVMLTLDQVIQSITEQELDKAVQKCLPDGAVAIVTRPSTGEVLAITSRPTFDPMAADKKIETLRNRALTDMIEPGSTYKTVAVAAALDQRIVTLDDRIYCENGKFLYAGRYLNDHEPYGMLTVAEVLMHSSNIGAAKIALLLGKERMHRAMLDFGFGARTFDEGRGRGWPGEIRGVVHPLRDWSKVSITRVAMGHEVGVTPMQMVNAIAAIANGGNLMRPQIIRRVVDGNGRVIREFFPQVRRRVVDPNAAHAMTDALCRVVSMTGTAQKAMVPGFSVAGKTGTAQKVVNGEYVHDQFFSSFCGYFPAEDPALCIYVMFDNPKGKEYYGGAVAAPVFREIAIRTASYLNLRPTQPIVAASDESKGLLRAAGKRRVP